MAAAVTGISLLAKNPLSLLVCSVISAPTLCNHLDPMEVCLQWRCELTEGGELGGFGQEKASLSLGQAWVIAASLSS